MTVADDGATRPFHVEGRIERLTRAEAVEAATAAGMPDYMAELSIFQVLLRHPLVANALNEHLSTFLFSGDLDDRLRELVIMRVGWQTGSVYEWGQHWKIAPRFGVSEEDLVGVRDWEYHEPFGPVERAVLAATDEVVGEGEISAETWEACAEQLGTKELLELVMVIGAWQMVSVILRSLKVPLEPDMDPWLPDQLGPDDSE